MDEEGWLAEEVERAVDLRAECIGDGRLTSIFAAFVFTEMKDIKPLNEKTGNAAARGRCARVP